MEKEKIVSKAEHCISLSNKNFNIELDKEFCGSFEGVVIPIQLGENCFEVTLNEDELNQAYKKYNCLLECQDETIHGIIAMEKLVRMLKLGLDITFSKNIVE